MFTVENISFKVKLYFEPSPKVIILNGKRVLYKKILFIVTVSWAVFYSNWPIVSSRNTFLKILASEMIWPKLGSFVRHLLQREAWRLLEKSARLPSCKSPLKISRHLVQLLTIRILIAYSIHLHSSVSCNCAMNKLRICFQWRNGHFELRMLLFSVGNGAMKPQRYWQRLDEACTEHNHLPYNPPILWAHRCTLRQ